LVFVPGAVERGKDDPRVVAFATTLARSRFAVLVPDVVALRELRLLPDSAADVAAALAWMRARPELAPDGRLGIVTTSVAVGPAMLAMLDPASGDVRFFLSIGGYYDLPRTLAYLTTGRYDALGVTRRDAPNDYGKWIYALSNAARLEDPAERAAFETLARRRLAEPNADVSGELRQLGPAGRAVLAFILNTDAARSRELLEQLPLNLRADVDRLNLAARDLSRLPGRFILVHGQDDGLIPYGESLGLAAALPRDRTRLFVLGGFQHVEMSPQLVDGVRLWRAINALLAER
jgi:acetyl esterase/lipase